MPKKNFIFSKVAGSKNKTIHTFFSRFLLKANFANLAHDFFEDCFPKPKLLLPANSLIYLNISISISKIHCSRSPRTL